MRETVSRVARQFSAKSPEPVGVCPGQARASAVSAALLGAADSLDTPGCPGGIRKISDVYAVPGDFLMKKPIAKKGVQAVLLPYWSSISVRKLMSTIRKTRPTTAIAVGFLVKQSRLDNVGDPIGKKKKGDLDNIKAILNGLRDSRRIDVIVHLSFHKHERNISGQALRRSAERIRDNLIIPYESRPEITFFISPQLEDYWDEGNYLNRAREVLKVVAFKNDDATKSTRLLSNVNLWRNSIFNDGDIENGLSPKIVDTSASVYNAEGVLEEVCLEAHPGYETHALSPDARFDAWSNDGVFVYDKQYDGYYDPPKDTDKSYQEYKNTRCTKNADDTKVREHVSLSKFKSQSPGHLALLWRPVYNLLRVTKWSSKKDASKMCYLDRNKENQSNYRDDDKNPRFNDREAAILRSFLK